MTLSVVWPSVISYRIDHTTLAVFDIANRQLADVLGDRPVFMVVDDAVWAIHRRAIQDYADRHLDCRAVVCMAGDEAVKTVSSATALCEKAIAAHVPRNGIFVAVGGGIVMDIAGFAASMYRRGVSYVRIPTTLIGMIDVAVGIKQGVNAGGLKNAIGSFYPPLCAFNDARFLATLSRRHLACGFAEAIKIALVCDSTLYQLIEAYASRLMETGFQEPAGIAHEVLFRSERAMIDELSTNLYESDRLRLADFGHTFSPAIETASDFAVAHGEAVALDMLLSIAVGIRAGIVPASLLERLATLYRAIGLPLHHHVMTFRCMRDALDGIRLNRDGNLNLVVPAAIGTGGFLQDVSPGDLAGALADVIRLADRPGSMNSVVVDLGGTFLRCGLVSPADELERLERTRLQAGPDTRGDAIWETIVAGIARFVSDNAAHIAPRVPIAIAFPGPVVNNRAAGQAPTVAGAGVVPDIAALVRERTGSAVVMLNDVSAAAWYFERLMPVDRFAVVTVSSGIGCKLFDRNGSGVIDDVPYAGEIGHLVVDRSADAPLCDCGGRGHLGAVSSGRGFERLARRVAERDAAAFAASTCVRTFGATAQTLTNEAHLVPALLSADRWAASVLAMSVAPLAEIAGIMTIAGGLQGLAIMGGFARELGPLYERALRGALGTISDCGAARVDLGDFVCLVPPGDEPGLIGAARFARSRLRLVA